MPASFFGESVLRGPSPGARGERFAAGFTLVELLLVVALLAVLSAVAVPRLTRSLQSSRLKEGAGDLAAIIREGRHEAVRRGLSVRLSVDRKESSYELDVLEPSHSYEETYTEFGDGLLDERHYLPEGIRFVQEGDSLTPVQEYVFSPSGVGDKQTVELSDRSGSRMRLELGTWYEDLSVTRVEETARDEVAAP